MKQRLMNKTLYSALIAGGIITMLLTPSDLLPRELTLDDAVDVALNRTARGEMIRGNLEVAEVIVKTKKPLAIKSFNDVQELGRFVLVQDENICAGGIITKTD